MAQITDVRAIVRDYVPGRKITEAGIYRNVPMDVYHGDLCDGPSASKSVFYTMEEKSPRHAFRDWYGNPNRKEQPEKAHFALGRAVHHLAGGEAEFAKFFAVRPPKWDSWRTDDAKKWRGQQKLAGMGVLEPKDVDTIKGVAESLTDHPTIQAGILKGLVEHTVVYRDAETGIWVKTRPDVIPVDSRMIVDLKTCADASRHKATKAIGEFGYHMQLAMIDDAMRVVTNSPLDKAWASEHVLVFVEKTDPWAINIKPLEDWALDYGRRQFRRAIRTFAECIASGVWPSYPDDEVATGLESWRANRLAWESENGLLPRLDGSQTSAKGWTPPDKPGAYAPVEDDEDEEAV